MQLHIRFAIGIIFILISVETIAQSIVVKKNIKKLEFAIDSIGEVKIRRQEARLDSLFKEKYIHQLEAVSNLQNNRDTYYGTVFGVLAVIFALLGIILAINWLGMLIQNRKAIKEHTIVLNKQKEQYDNSIAEQMTKSKLLLEEQSVIFNETFAKQKSDYLEIKGELNSLMLRNEEAISQALSSMEERINLQASGGIKDDEIDKMKKSIEELRSLKESLAKDSFQHSGKSSGTFGSIEYLDESNFIKIKCVNPKCLKTFRISKPNLFETNVAKNVALMGSLNPQPKAKCPFCETFNDIPTVHRWLF